MFLFWPWTWSSVFGFAPFAPKMISPPSTVSSDVTIVVLSLKSCIDESIGINSVSSSLDSLSVNNLSRAISDLENFPIGFVRDLVVVSCLLLCSGSSHNCAFDIATSEFRYTAPCFAVTVNSFDEVLLLQSSMVCLIVASNFFWPILNFCPLFFFISVFSFSSKNK